MNNKIWKPLILLWLMSFSISSVANMAKVRAALEDENYQVAKTELDQLSQIGNASAQFTLGLLHYQGKAGAIDKIAAYSWLKLAAEYNYPNASAYADVVYQELGAKEKQQASASFKTYEEKFGSIALLDNVFPMFTDQEIAAQRVTEPARELSRVELRADDLAYVDKLARATNERAKQSQAVNDRLGKFDEGRTQIRELSSLVVGNSQEERAAKRAVIANSAPFGPDVGDHGVRVANNLTLTNQESVSGLVIVKHDVDKGGNVMNPEVIFSFPAKQFDDAVLNSVSKSQFSPALQDDKKVEQHGVITVRRIGATGPNSYRTRYPLRYREFLKIKNKALKTGDIKAKYRYANLLRAYEDIIAAEQPTSYPVLLKELSDEGVIEAQFDLAQYLIFEKGDFNMGLDWLVKAAKAGHVAAEYRLGDLLLNPPSPYLLEDKKKAAFWLDRASKKGFSEAERKLAMLSHQNQSTGM